MGHLIRIAAERSNSSLFGDKMTPSSIPSGDKAKGVPRLRYPQRHLPVFSIL